MNIVTWQFPPNLWSVKKTKLPFSSSSLISFLYAIDPYHNLLTFSETKREFVKEKKNGE